MAHPLQDFRLKLNRAQDHLEALEREIDAWFDKHPYGVTGKYDAGPPEQYVLYLRFFEPPPREWGLLIGEFAHNARSALDYLAWQLVKANNKAPNRRTQFPIIIERAAWCGKHGRERLRGASDRHVRLVEALQPYNRRDANGATYPTKPGWAMGHPLALLASLSNEDKHRVLIVTAAALSSIGWDVIASVDVEPITDLGDAYTGPLEDGSPLITIPVKATGPNPDVEMEFQERARVTIDQRVELKDGAAIETRVDLLDSMDQIATELRRIFQIFVREFV